MSNGRRGRRTVVERERELGEGEKDPLSYHNASIIAFIYTRSNIV